MLRRLGIFLAALFAVALATVEPHASATPSNGRMLVTTSVPTSVGASLDSELSCAVTTGSVIGPCPRALVRRPAPARMPVIRLCFMTHFLPLLSAQRREPVLCGTGFRPDTRVVIVIRGRYSSTSLRAVSDANGGLDLPLPWPPCALTPGSIVAFDHRSWSNALPVPSGGCF